MSVLLPSEHDAPPTPDPPQEHHPRRRRRALIWSSVTLAAVLASGGVFAAYAAHEQQSAPPPTNTDITTATIARGTLSGEVPVPGTLTFADPRQVPAAASGVVTSLPDEGSTLNPGDALYAINNARSFLFAGNVPAWRDFASGMTDGPDVAALEASLKSMGFFDGDPDEKFSWATKAAIYRWQKHTGQKEDGVIPFGRVVFSPGALRVSSVATKVGDTVGTGSALFDVTSPSKLVQANVKLSDQRLAVLDAPVTIDLPAGEATTGRITSVGTPTETETSSGKTEVVIPIVVSLDDAAATGEIQQASVTVHLPAEQKENVLIVPIEALIALDADTFGVEILRKDGTTTRVPVTTGLFAAGQVEVAGKDISEGQKVVVPSL